MLDFVIANPARFVVVPAEPSRSLRARSTGRIASQLNASHVAAVLGLSEAVQARMLGQAEANDWTASRLKQEVERRKVIEPRPNRVGRPALPGFVRTVNRWERELAAGEEFYGDLDQVAGLDEVDAARIEAAVLAQRQQCDALLAALARRRQ